jgi:hypothetical protein
MNRNFGPSYSVKDQQYELGLFEVRMWQAIDQAAARYKKHLRPLYMTIEFSSASADSCWLAALRWMKEVFTG